MQQYWNTLRYSQPAQLSADAGHCLETTSPPGREGVAAGRNTDLTSIHRPASKGAWINTMKTEKNLMAAFAGESQANRRYLAFAAKAEKEGFKNIGRIYRAIAEAETLHALKHLETAGQVKTTAENLAASKDGEEHEFTVMYPEFIETAVAEGHKAALRTFEYANAAEQAHGAIFATLLAMVNAGGDHPDEAVSLCPVCGWVVTGEAPERCPICNTMAKAFRSF